MSFYCIGNWKMHKTPQEAKTFLQTQKLKSTPKTILVGFAVPSLVGQSASEALKDSSVLWGGQNCYSEKQGAFTGETSPYVLKEMGASFCLVGHSERRQVFLETDEMIGNKVKAVQDNGMTPLLCIGETSEDRKWNRTEEVVLSQLRQGLAKADTKKPLWVAYEPVWAIGTGQVATLEQVEHAHKFIHRFLVENFRGGVPVLYGGSVKPDNAGAISKLESVNGFLVGGASLDIDVWNQLLGSCV